MRKFSLKRVYRFRRKVAGQFDNFASKAPAMLFLLFRIATESLKPVLIGQY